MHATRDTSNRISFGLSPIVDNSPALATIRARPLATALRGAGTKTDAAAAAAIPAPPWMHGAQRQVQLSGPIGIGTRDGGHNIGGGSSSGSGRVSISSYNHHSFALGNEAEPVERLPAAVATSHGGGCEAVADAAAPEVLSVRPSFTVEDVVSPHFLNRQDATVLLQECTTGDGAFLFRVDSIASPTSGGGGGGSSAEFGVDSQHQLAERGEEQQERDLLFLSLLFKGTVHHHPIVTRSDQLYLGPRPFHSLEAMVLYHTQRQEDTGDLTLQCPLGQQCVPGAQQQPGSVNGVTGLVRRPLIDASRDMLDCDSLLDELEGIVHRQTSKRRAFAFAPVDFLPQSNA